jgi:hypothetical protein
MINEQATRKTEKKYLKDTTRYHLIVYEKLSRSSRKNKPFSLKIHARILRYGRGLNLSISRSAMM